MVTYPYLTGVLNSTLLNFVFAGGSPLPDAPKVRRLEPHQLHDLPVFVAGEETTCKLAKFIEGNVICLVHVKQARHIMTGVWSYLAGLHARRYARLGQLLGNALPGQKEPWVKKLFPSLAQLNRRSRRFQSIRFQGDREEPVLRVYGRTESGDETVLAEADFADRELMTFACLCAAADRKRRSRAMTVRRFMEEEVVPVADDVTAGARLVTSQLLVKTPKVLSAEGIPAPQLDPVRMEHETERLEALVDAEVFRIYGLGWEQADAVMNRLPVGNLERQRVKTYFERLDLSQGPKTPEPNPELTSSPEPAAP